MIYLDNCASTRAYDEAADTVKRYMLEDYFNPSASYAAALPEEKAFDWAREALAGIMGAHSVYFTSGGTEGANAAIKGVFDALQGGETSKSEIIISEVEHPAVYEAAFSLRARGVRVLVAPVKQTGEADIDQIAEMVNPNTALVSIMHVNNETGVINDIDAIARAVKQKNPMCLIHSDGVQGHLRLKMPAGADIYTTSAHKAHGPKGVGAMAVKKGVKLAPFIYGGGQQDKMRSGTINMPGIMGYFRAAEMFVETGALERIRAVKNRYLGLISELDGAHIIGAETAPHIICAAFEGVQAASLQSALEARGVIVGKGSACSSRKAKVSRVLTAMKVPSKYAEGAVRIGIGAFNTLEECEEAVRAIREALSYLRRFKRR